MGRPKRTTARIAGLRRRLAGLEGRQYWQRLRELVGAEGLEEVLHAGASDEPRGSLSRRRFLALTAASLGLAGLSGCGVRAPEAEILPYVRAPQDMVPGRPLQFATAMSLDGEGVGLVSLDCSDQVS